MAQPAYHSHHHPGGSPHMNAMTNGQSASMMSPTVSMAGAYVNKQGNFAPQQPQPHVHQSKMTPAMHHPLGYHSHHQQQQHHQMIQAQDQHHFHSHGMESQQHQQLQTPQLQQVVMEQQQHVHSQPQQQQLSDQADSSNEESIAAEDVGAAFAYQYFRIMKVRPDSLFRFYDRDSKVSRGSDSEKALEFRRAVGQKEISELLRAEHVNGVPLAVAIIKTIEGQDSNGGAVLLQITGSLKYIDDNSRDFSMTVYLAKQNNISATGYYVQNDLLVFHDLVVTIPPHHPFGSTQALSDISAHGNQTTSSHTTSTTTATSSSAGSYQPDSRLNYGGIPVAMPLAASATPAASPLPTTTAPQLAATSPSFPQDFHASSTASTQYMSTVDAVSPVGVADRRVSANQSATYYQTSAQPLNLSVDVSPIKNAAVATVKPGMMVNDGHVANYNSNKMNAVLTAPQQQAYIHGTAVAVDDSKLSVLSHSSDQQQSVHSTRKDSHISSASSIPDSSPSHATPTTAVNNCAVRSPKVTVSISIEDGGKLSESVIQLSPAVGASSSDEQNEGSLASPLPIANHHQIEEEELQEETQIGEDSSPSFPQKFEEEEDVSSSRNELSIEGGINERDETGDKVTPIVQEVTVVSSSSSSGVKKAAEKKSVWKVTPAAAPVDMSSIAATPQPSQPSSTSSTSNNSQARLKNARNSGVVMPTVSYTSVNPMNYSSSSYAGKLLHGGVRSACKIGFGIHVGDETNSKGDRDTNVSSGSNSKARPKKEQKTVYISHIPRDIDDERIKRAVADQLKGTKTEGHVVRIERLPKSSYGLIELDSEPCVFTLIDRGLCIAGEQVIVDFPHSSNNNNNRGDGDYYTNGGGGNNSNYHGQHARNQRIRSIEMDRDNNDEYANDGGDRDRYFNNNQGRGGFNRGGMGGGYRGYRGGGGARSGGNRDGWVGGGYDNYRSNIGGGTSGYNGNGGGGGRPLADHSGENGSGRRTNYQNGSTNTSGNNNNLLSPQRHREYINDGAQANNANNKNGIMNGNYVDGADEGSDWISTSKKRVKKPVTEGAVVGNAGGGRGRGGFNNQRGGGRGGAGGGRGAAGGAGPRRSS